MLTRLIESTRGLITEQLAISRKPVVAGSFGKESMVMLYLILSIKPEMAVIYFPGFPHPTKHAWPERMAREWNLNLFAPFPSARDAISKDGHVELIELYELAPGRFMYFPIEAAPGYEPDRDSHCALAQLHEGPTSSGPADFDAVLIGHRNDDVDPTHGPAPLREYVVDTGDFRYVYPLKDWTESDVWEASRLLGIPQNEARYRDRDMDANNDYYDLCTRCFPGSAGQFVACPKTGLDVPVVGREAEMEERRAQWRQVFVNIA